MNGNFAVNQWVQVNDIGKSYLKNLVLSFTLFDRDLSDHFKQLSSSPNVSTFVHQTNTLEGFRVFYENVLRNSTMVTYRTFGALTKISPVEFSTTTQSFDRLSYESRFNNSNFRLSGSPNQCHR